MLFLIEMDFNIQLTGRVVQLVKMYIPPEIMDIIKSFAVNPRKDINKEVKTGQLVRPERMWRNPRIVQYGCKYNPGHLKQQVLHWATIQLLAKYHTFGTVSNIKQNTRIINENIEWFLPDYKQMTDY